MFSLSKGVQSNSNWSIITIYLRLTLSDDVNLNLYDYILHHEGGILSDNLTVPLAGYQKNTAHLI